MKKLLTIVASAALLLGLVSCGSTGGAAKADAPAFKDHPMTYTLDIMDGLGGDTIKFVDNSQYGTPGESTRQNNGGGQYNCPDWTKLVKPNKIKKGDKVLVTGKFTSDIDIDKLSFNLVDPSAAAGYWTVLGDGTPMFENVKAGETIDINYTFDIIADMKAQVILNMAYGEQNKGMAVFACERVGESDIGALGEIVDPQHKEPKTWEFDISKNAAYIEMKPEYPWVNGVQDTMADPLCYQCVLDITGIFPDGDQPIAGDKLHLTWKTKCNTDISSIQVRAVENTAPVNWWKEIDKYFVENSEPYTFAENIVADEVNNFVIDIELCDGIVAGISLCINYSLDAADGSSLFTYVRDDPK